MIFLVEKVDWTSASQRLTELREKVFVLEWQMPRDCEFDELDRQAIHIILSNEQGEAIATARLTPCGEIGRVAIRIGYRKLIVYRKLFSVLIEHARLSKMQNVTLNCDIASVEHHTRLGFTATGQAFMEAGIARQPMSCPVSRFKLPDVTQLH
ncbi:GNAT family N-acetyltransferase [Salinimonas marina]|uniref:GNAT family N-acetyltransferase n=1 Tax=Salinimonas marina TaxID=2785918 RepID=A0A7S9DZL6_9ALTE|nr:GNAT family N-acetyltransferase [Salinimonas marina]QPG06837.1 GNAT family N-acetyltransferase [Salinimonas marina]